jgi:hypothetical protein
MIEGEVEVLEIDALPQQRGDRFAARTGLELRALATPYRWFRISRAASRLGARWTSCPTAS